jgi:hypothetical protein
MAGKERFFDLGSSSDTEDYGETDSLRYKAVLRSRGRMKKYLPGTE